MGLLIIKNEHPKGFGALEDCPNKKNAKLLAAAGSAIDRLEGDGIKQTKKTNLFYTGYRCRVGVLGFWHGYKNNKTAKRL